MLLSAETDAKPAHLVSVAKLVYVPNFRSGLDVRERNLRQDLQAVGLERDELSRVIGEDPHRVDIQRRENLRADAVLALFAAERDRLVRIDAFFAVSLDLRRKIRLSRLAHLRQVQQHPAAFRRDDLHRAIHLFMAMAGHRTEDVADEAVRVDAHQHIFAVFDVAFHQRVVRFVSENALESDHAEIAVPRWQHAFADFSNEAFRSQPITNEIRHRDHLHVVTFARIPQDPEHAPSCRLPS